MSCNILYFLGKQTERGRGIMGKMREKKKKKKNLIETGNGDECSMNRSPFSLVWFLAMVGVWVLL